MLGSEELLWEAVNMATPKKKTHDPRYATAS